MDYVPKVVLFTFKTRPFCVALAGLEVTIEPKGTSELQEFPLLPLPLGTRNTVWVGLVNPRCVLNKDMS